MDFYAVSLVFYIYFIHDKGNEYGLIHYQGVIKLTDKAMRKIDTSTRGNIAYEILKHMELCVTEARNFMGREDDLRKV